MSSVDELLAGSALSLSEARILLGHALRVGPPWIIARGRDPVAEGEARAVEALFARRRAGEPIAYLTGEREFRGLSLRVNPGVLIPRPETELLVEQVLDIVKGRTVPRIVDLGTGSGAIAVAVAHARPDADVWASDTSADAIEIASANAARHAVSIRFIRGDWLDALGEERFEVIASNPPYVPEGDPHLAEGDVRYEPRAALVGGADGLDCIRRIASDARTRLVPGGWLVLEHGFDQGTACVRLLTGLGYTTVSDSDDLAGLPRVCKGQFDVVPPSG